jgi:hypothetical protein
MKPLLGFLSIFLLGLVSGVSFSHFLQRGPKATLPGVQFLAVTHECGHSVTPLQRLGREFSPGPTSRAKDEDCAY